MTTISAVLRYAVRDRGPQPLITYYDLASGERTELSCTSFANWVDKTVNLLDDVGVEAGEDVAVSVASAHPGHWISLVWVTAVVCHGARVTGAGPGPGDQAIGDQANGDQANGDLSDAAAEVIGPEAEPVSGADQVWACSLHPLGLGFSTDLPAGVDDYSVEVRAQPDQPLPSMAAPADAAWLAADRTWSQADLVAQAEQQPTGRWLLPLEPTSDPLEVFVRAILGPLVQSGSSVVVTGSGSADTELATISQSERVDGIVR